MSRTKDAIMDYHAELGIEDAFYPRGWTPKKGKTMRHICEIWILLKAY